MKHHPPPRDGPGFAFTAADDHGPPGSYGTWRLRTPGDGPDLTVTLGRQYTTEPTRYPV